MPPWALGVKPPSTFLLERPLGPPVLPRPSLGPFVTRRWPGGGDRCRIQPRAAVPWAPARGLQGGCRWHVPTVTVRRGRLVPQERPKPRVPVVHFRAARPPFVICVKLVSLVGGAGPTAGTRPRAWWVAGTPDTWLRASTPVSQAGSGLVATRRPWPRVGGGDCGRCGELEPQSLPGRPRATGVSNDRWPCTLTRLAAPL